MKATLADAIHIAVEAHGNMTDKAGREPYILHPIRVMLAQRDEEARMAAILHDTVEDTAVTFEQLEAAGFPTRVIEALRLLTHDDDTPYDDYVRRLKDHSIARRVKLADLEDNMDVRRLDHLREKDLTRLTKYLRAWRLLKEADRAAEAQLSAQA